MSIARWLSGAGGLIGIVSVGSGLLGEGGTVPYQPRFAFALLAVLLAAIAGALPFWPRVSLRSAGFLVFPAGLAGFLATQLWFINTYYVFAVPVWLVASVLLISSAPRVTR